MTLIFLLYIYGSIYAKHSLPSYSNYFKSSHTLHPHNFIIMSNLANYSPYNKTYKFILFQNQAYHHKNKIHASPLVRTNLRHSISRYSPTKNPELEAELLNSSSPNRSESPSTQLTRSFLYGSQKNIENPIIHEDKRVIHKHESFDKFRRQKIYRDNVAQVSRLVNASCHVIKNKKAEDSFQKHQNYRNIRMKYHDNGPRKECIPLGNTSLLCPTLMEFNLSGLAQKWVETDLSLSPRKPSTSRSIRRSHNSQAI